jgi:hypothetical protein
MIYMKRRGRIVLWPTATPRQASVGRGRGCIRNIPDIRVVVPGLASEYSRAAVISNFESSFIQPTDGHVETPGWACGVGLPVIRVYGEHIAAIIDCPRLGKN